MRDKFFYMQLVITNIIYSKMALPAIFVPCVHQCVHKIIQHYSIGHICKLFSVWNTCSLVTQTLRLLSGRISWNRIWKRKTTFFWAELLRTSFAFDLSPWSAQKIKKRRSEIRWYKIKRWKDENKRDKSEDEEVKLEGLGVAVITWIEIESPVFIFVYYPTVILAKTIFERETHNASNFKCNVF